jgi:pimeloyl-ACP methyl ester carboxylesterase
MFDQATIHEGLLRELGIDTVHLLAHDYGDTVAQELLARHDERRRQSAPGPKIESAVLLNGGLFPEAHRPRRIQKILAGPLGPIAERLTSKRAFGAGLTAIFGPSTPPSSQFVDELWTMLRHHDGHLVLHLLLGYMAERRQNRERWVNALINTTVPYRVINGLADPVSGAHLVARLREVIPSADVTELPTIGHYPHVEDPAGVLKSFLEFHSRQRAP